ncbi:MAG TPA: GNAT family N-acetyltransferase, partial [Methylomirabilota bacterium]
QEGQIVGVLCAALTPVRVAGRACFAGYIFNVRVERGVRTRGVGSMMMRAGEEWLESQGAQYVTGLISVTNVASMKMVTSLGWRSIGRFDYLVLDLGRFSSDPEVRIRKVDALGDRAHAAWRFGEVFLHNFVPRNLVSELFQPYPRGPYMGSLTAFGPGGSAWLSLWDDRARRGLDPSKVRAVKAYDVTLKGEGGFRAFSAIAATLHEAGLDHLLMPIPHDVNARALVDPFISDLVEFNFCVKRLNGAPPVPSGPIYFDIRH